MFYWSQNLLLLSVCTYVFCMSVRIYRLSIDSAIMRFISLAPCYPTWRYKLSLAQHRLPLWFPRLERWRAWLEAVIWMALSILLALYVPQIKYVISPMGCLAGLFILVFPGEKFGLCEKCIALCHYYNQAEIIHVRICIV